MHLTSIDVKNLRVFRETSFKLPPVDPDRKFSNVYLFLGTNGSGKTSLLRAIAMTAIAAVLPSSGMRPYSLVRRVGKTSPGCVLKAEFALAAQDGNAKTLRSEVCIDATRGFSDKFGKVTFPKTHEALLWDDGSPAFFVVGYGASRLPEPQGSSQSENPRGRSLRYQRVAGLFEEFVPLRPLRSWLLNYKNKGRHRQVVTLINELLEDVDVRLNPEPVDDEYLFEMNGAQLPLSALSDGYRAYIGWISDLLYHVCLGCPPGKKLRQNCGIVLIDEVDLHLHPQWQRVVIERLSVTLPNLQFFFTTHSPLVSGSLPSANTFLVRTANSKAGAKAEPSELDIYGWSVDQILNSPLFAETPSRNTHAIQAIAAASAKARRGDRDAAMELMAVLADGVKSPLE